MCHSLVCWQQQGIRYENEGNWQDNQWFWSTFWGYSNNKGIETHLSGYSHRNYKGKKVEIDMKEYIEEPLESFGE